MEFDQATTERLAAELRRQLDESMRDAVAKGVVIGVKELAADTDFADDIGAAMYKRFSGHVRDDVSKSVGKKVLTWLSAILLAGALYLSAKAGLIK